MVRDLIELWPQVKRGSGQRTFMRLAVLLLVCMNAVAGWAEEITSFSSGASSTTTTETGYSKVVTVTSGTTTIKLYTDASGEISLNERIVFGPNIKKLGINVSSTDKTISSVTLTYRSNSDNKFSLLTTAVTSTTSGSISLSTSAAEWSGINASSATATIGNGTDIMCSNTGNSNGLSIESITITYSTSTLTSPNLSFSKESLSLTVGDNAPTAPTLSSSVKAYKLSERNVTYYINDAEVTADNTAIGTTGLSISKYGTLSGTATTATTTAITITAKTAADDTYSAGEASYTISISGGTTPSTEGSTITFDKADGGTKAISNLSSATFTDTDDDGNNFTVAIACDKNVIKTYKKDSSDNKLAKIGTGQSSNSNSFTITLSSDALITGVKINYSNSSNSISNNKNAIVTVATNGSETYTSDTNWSTGTTQSTWTSDGVSSVSFKVYSGDDGTNLKNIEIQSIEVTYSTVEKTATTMTIDPAERTCKVGSIVDLTGITVKAKDGDTTIENPTLTYTSSDEDVISVDEGVVGAAQTAGTTTITVTYPGDATHKGCTGSFTVKVSEKPTISLGRSAISFKIESKDASSDAVKTNTYTVKEGSENYTGTVSNVKVSSSNDQVVSSVTANNGTITLTYPTDLVAGSSTITLTLNAGEDEISASFLVTVLPADSKEVVIAEEHIAGEKVDGANVSMTFGGVVRPNTSSNTNIRSTSSKTKGIDYTVGAETGYYETNDDALIESVTAKGKGTDGYYFNHGLAQESTNTYDRFMNLPVYGDYFIFEPTKDGVLTIDVDQQGAVHTDGEAVVYEKARIRPVYFVDDRGICVQANSATTSTKISPDWMKVGDKDHALVSDNMFSKPTDVKAFYDACVGTNGLNLKIDDTEENKSKNQNGVVPIFVLHSTDGKAYRMTAEGKTELTAGNETYGAMLAQYNNGGTFNANWPTYNDGAGYFTLDEAQVTYKFNVKSGKTYFLFGDRTKLGIKSFSLDANDQQASAATVSLSGDVTSPDLAKDKIADVTVSRTFTEGRWASLVLPFSVSPSKVKEVFGENTKIILLNNVDTESSTLHLTKHFHQMIVAGMPMFIKPGSTVTSPEFENVKIEATTVDDVVDEESGFRMTGCFGNERQMANNSLYMGNNGNLDVVKRYQGDGYQPKGTFAWITYDAQSGDDTSEAKMLNFSISGIDDEEETTGIIEAIAEAEISSGQATTKVYNMSGQMVGDNVKLSTLSKGIYIVAGKKYVVK